MDNVEPGPKLQSLIDQIGTATREEFHDTDALWLVNAPVETMTPEEIAELTGDAYNEDPYLVADFVGGEDIVSTSVLPFALSGGLNQVSGTLLGGSSIEETKMGHLPESILEQEAWEFLDNEDIDDV